MACVIASSVVVVLDLAPVPIPLDNEFDMPPITSVFVDKNVTIYQKEPERIRVEAINPRVVFDKESFGNDEPRKVKGLSNLGVNLSHSFLVGCDGGNMFLLEWTWRKVKPKKLQIDDKIPNSNLVSIHCNKKSNLLLVNLNNMIWMYRIKLRIEGDNKQFLKVNIVGPICSEKRFLATRWLDDGLFAAVVDYGYSNTSKSDEIVVVWHASRDGNYRVLTSLSLKNERIQEYFSAQDVEIPLPASISSYSTSLQYNSRSGCISFCMLTKLKNISGKQSSR